MYLWVILLIVCEIIFRLCHFSFKLPDILLDIVEACVEINIQFHLNLFS